MLCAWPVMRWWLRAHLDVSALTLVALGVLTIPFWGSTEMPILRIGQGPATFVVFLPALVASGIVGAIQGGSALYEAMSARRAGALSRILAIAAAAAVALLWMAWGYISVEIEVALAAARNLAGYLGIGLIVLRISGGVVGGAAPVIYAVGVAVLGSTTSGVWAWPLYGGLDARGLAIAAIAGVAGLIFGAGRAALRVQARRAP